MDLRFAAGAGRWKDGGRSVSRVSLARDGHGIEVPVHEVRPASTMNVKVDKSGANPASTSINRLPAFGDPARRGSDIADPSVAADDNGIFDEAIGQDSRASHKRNNTQAWFSRRAFMTRLSISYSAV